MRRREEGKEGDAENDAVGMAAEADEHDELLAKKQDRSNEHLPAHFVDKRRKWRQLNYVVMVLGCICGASGLFFALKKIVEDANNGVHTNVHSLRK